MRDLYDALSLTGKKERPYHLNLFSIALYRWQHFLHCALHKNFTHQTETFPVWLQLCESFDDCIMLLQEFET